MQRQVKRRFLPTPTLVDWVCSKISDYANGIRTSFFRRVENNKDVYSPSKIINDNILAEHFCASYSLAQTYNTFVLNYYMLRGHEGENPVFFNNSIRESRQPLAPVEGWNEGNPYILHNLTLADHKFSKPFVANK